MTKEQYERWKDFALRMARTCFANRRRPSASWIIEQVESWFYWRDYQEDHGEYNSWDQDDFPLCDHVSEFFDDYPAVCCRACSQSRWDDGYDATLECRCQEKGDLAWEQYDDQWYGPVRCCLRAGIDFACEPSAGVMGFTVGDVRKMYPEGVPEWITQGDEKWCPWLAREHDESECHTFAEMPDSMGIVL